MRVALSVGHGQKRSGGQVLDDPGAVHESLGVSEHQTCLRIQRILVPMLEEFPGLDVDPVPTGVHLAERVRYIVDKHGGKPYDLAVELHMNGAVPQAHGTESLHYPDSELGIRWADRLNQWMVDVLGTRDRGIKEGWYRQDHPHRVDYPGDVEGDEILDYFLRATPCPAVIVEPEFITNDDVAGWAINGDFVQRTAWALFCGLTEEG